MDLDRLKEFRQSAYDAMGKAKDAVFELMDAVLLTRSVSSFAELSLSPVFRRQWSSLYEAIYDSRPQKAKLRKLYIEQILQNAEKRILLAWIIHEHFEKSVKAQPLGDFSNLLQKQCVFENGHSIKGLTLGK